MVSIFALAGCDGDDGGTPRAGKIKGSGAPAMKLRKLVTFQIEAGALQGGLRVDTLACQGFDNKNAGDVTLEEDAVVGSCFVRGGTEPDTEDNLHVITVGNPTGEKLEFTLTTIATQI